MIDFYTVVMVVSMAVIVVIVMVIMSIAYESSLELFSEMNFNFLGKFQSDLFSLVEVRSKIEG